ncbi:MAG: prepilin-type N-terminal cleavage/methylation domain-containing protein [Planctomycetota bacterium]|jgi:general secretion pathway protein G
MNRNKGFTLVEILIVVIILGILAAIVIPQFTEASNDARESALATDLQSIRSQIELYKIQHFDEYPGETTPGNGVIEVVGADLVTDLTVMTNAEGNQVQGVGETPVNLGPYLPTFPRNAFINDDTKNNLVSAGGAVPAGDASTGWHLNTLNGRLSPNDAAGHTGL